MRSFDSNGQMISFLDQGRGEAVVPLHGFATSSTMWTKTLLVPDLAREFRVVIPDLRGHGRSAKPHEPQLYGGEMAEDVVRLLTHLNIDKAHLVGYSMGATVAGKVLASHPDRLLSVVFGAGAPLLSASGAFAALREATAASLEQGKGLVPLLLALAPEGEPPSSQQLAATGQQFLAGNDPIALAASLRGQPGLVVTEEQLRASHVPVCFVYGRREGAAKERIAAARQVFPAAQVVIVERGDHMNTFARREFRQAVLEFLRAHRR